MTTLTALLLVSALAGPALPESDTNLHKPVVESVVGAQGRRVEVRRAAGPLVEVVAIEVDGATRVLAQGDRVALSPDAEWVAFVSSAPTPATATGLASVYVVPFLGGEPRQLTNVGLVATPGRGLPPGFVAPPHVGGLTFDGDRLRWTSSASQEVSWR